MSALRQLQTLVTPLTLTTLLTVATRHQNSIAQVILRWLSQRGIVVPSKSVRKERMAEKPSRLAA